MTVPAAAQSVDGELCNQGPLAELVVDYLDSWKNAHLAYREFSGCDDGGVAEGLSDAVVRLLAHDWRRLPELLPMIQADPKFEAFVLKHIDATTDDDDLKAIERQSMSSCPANEKALCVKLNFAAKKAISEVL